MNLLQWRELLTCNIESTENPADIATKLISGGQKHD